MDDFDHLHRWEPGRWNPDLHRTSAAGLLRGVTLIALLLASALIAIVTSLVLMRFVEALL